jgi:hypothetical protein
MDGTALQVAKKLVLYQGTTLVGPSLGKNPGL